MPLTTKEAILGLKDLGQPIKFHVPEWGDDVYLRRPTANDRDAWEVYIQEHGKTPHKIWRAKLAAMMLCDADGKLLFSDREAEKLGERSATALHRIWERCLELMRISEQEVAELEKN